MQNTQERIQRKARKTSHTENRGALEGLRDHRSERVGTSGASMTRQDDFQTPVPPDLSMESVYV